MGHNKLTVQLQDFTTGITGALSWRDVTTDCMRIQPKQGHKDARQFMPEVGTCAYIFKNPSGTYTPVGNREDSSATYLEVGRRIRHIVTLPTHGNALKVSYANTTTLNAGYLAQSSISATVLAKQQITLEFEARCESEFLRNAIRVEIRTNAPETCEGEIFELTRKYRVYTITTMAQAGATSLEVRFYNLFTADATVVEFRNMGLFVSGAPSTNALTNPDFDSGTTGWTGTNATLTGISDYNVMFDGWIQSVDPAPFALAGDKVTYVVAHDPVHILQQASAKFALQKNKRADQLITTALSNLPATYWVQAPPGKLLAQGHQLFERAFTGYTEKETTLYQAIGDAVESENGMFWCDQDGTYRFENNTFHSRRARREGVVRPAWIILQANPADNDQIGFFGATYRFKNTPAAAYDVLIGATASVTAQNLANAVNMDAATLGTSYYSTTPIHDTCEASLADYFTVILADDPEVYLRLGESSGVDAADSSGNGHTSTYVNGVTLSVTGSIPSDGSTGVTLDGTNDNVSIPTIPLYMASYSLEMWLKAGAAPAAYQDVFSAYSAFVADQAFYVRINSNGSLTVDFYLDSYTTGTGVITFGGAYQHLVITYNVITDTLYIYVNGLQVGSSDVGFFDSTTSPTITLGGFPAAASNYFKGSLDEFALYLTALTPAQVAKHYAARFAGVALIKYRDINQTPELTLTEGNLDQYNMRPSRSLETVINKSMVTWTPRTTTTGNITLGQIQGAVQIPPKSTVSSNVKLGYPNVADGRVGTQELTITFRDDSGRFISGDDILDPVATTDYRIYERSDAGGYEYTTQSNYFWISNIQKNATQFTCVLNNNAIGALYATTFQVRGKAVYSYDEQEEKSVNQTSIDLYRERSLERRMPFTNDQQFAKSLAGYVTERYGYPFVEAQSIDVSNRDTLNGQYLLGLGLMDTIIITDARSGLSGVRHMIVGISMTLTPTSTNDYLESIRFTLERLDQNQYFILSDSTYGELSSDSRLYI